MGEGRSESRNKVKASRFWGLVAVAQTLAMVVATLTLAQEPDAETSEFATTAEDLATKSLLVDTHIDMPYGLQDGWADVTQLAPDRNFDFERAVQGGLDVAFMSIYTPAEMEEEGGAYELANHLIDSVEAVVGRQPEKATIVRSTTEVQAARWKGLLALALGMENGTPIEGDLRKLRHFYERGVRYVTLTHSLSNHISDSSYDENRPWGGLSPFGREVVSKMNELGIMVDVSHVSDAAFYQVLEVSSVPVIASHSSARHFTPGWERNMSDDMIRALADKGGVIQINFGSTFLTQAANEWYEKMKPAREAWAAETGNKTSGPAADAWQEEYRKANPFPYAAISDIADHFDHVIKLAGVEHVGIGSDFDGVGDSLPVGMKDVSAYPALVEEFLRREYSEEDIRAILGGNLMRVWAEVEQFASNQTE